ncbi:AAA-like domain-containing protein [Oscillatoria salina]|uniref:AAA-like domain-containing protein n=1 Tax=Oscillatoria salina TaxID=331517 RepID=UPI0013B8A7F2|nr:AAA-like domain-containing protein [Oscillatoria salina]MBZ8179187.1 hypothetical protein [Oscillatoria salina IIICB1]NET89727.1 hypothetical protein [Kamptonema sp. SIO1D9]
MELSFNSAYSYQVGGSLPVNSPTYAIRKADAELYQGIRAGEFCYVLNSRQMGKSSLRVRTMQRLQAQGICCVAVDLTAIGSQNITSDRWYAGITYTLASSFHLLEKIDLGDWWCQREFLSPVQRLDAFLQEILLPEIAEEVVIFIDEIDSVLSLNFPVNDFFALIRACYNKRAYKSEYQRLTWVLLGVATPSELITDKDCTPFNIGRPIRLTGFHLGECAGLARGLANKADNPLAVLKVILAWTAGKPFLTQKICHLVQTNSEFIAQGKEVTIIEKIVRSQIIENWEAQDEPEHLRSIRSRLLHKGDLSVKLLTLYQEILEQGEILADESSEQIALRLSGLVVKVRAGKRYNKPVLKVYNSIYKLVFNLNWVKEELKKLNPSVDFPEINTQPTSSDEQILYDHWLDLVEKETPEALLKRFRQLFIDGKNYPNPEIEAALYRIVAFLDNPQNFKYILNRCCTILINHWQRRSQRETAIFSLVDMLENASPRSRIIASYSLVVRRLQQLRQIFIQSEEFLSLKRLLHVVEPHPKIVDLQTDIPLGQLIRRYPYLYNHYLMCETSSYEQRQAIRDLQTQQQREFEISLSQYATYLVRQLHASKNSPRIVTPLSNPTLLSDRELYDALKQFIGKVDGSYSYRDLAQIFLTRTTRTHSYKDFKADLYEYLVANIDPKYGNNYFNKRLERQLQDTFPESENLPLNEMLLMRTCSKLFKFLVETPEHPNYYLFIDLVSNLGVVRTMGLLLKIALLSRPVKPHLEKQFSLLFNYYESQRVEEISWLVCSLENLNVALVTNFGTIDLSFLERNIQK